MAKKKVKSDQTTRFRFGDYLTEVAAAVTIAGITWLIVGQTTIKDRLDALATFQTSSIGITKNALRALATQSIPEAKAHIKDLDDFLARVATSKRSKSTISLIRPNTGQEIDFLTLMEEARPAHASDLFDRVASPQWHPSAPLLLFTGYFHADKVPGTCQRSSEIYVFDYLRERLVKLTQNNICDRRPKWSPDGAQVVWERAHEAADGSLQYAAWLRSFDVTQFVATQDGGWIGGGEHQLVGAQADGPLFHATHPTFSSIRGWLMVTAQKRVSEGAESAPYNLYIVDTETGKRVHRLFPTVYQCKGNWFVDGDEHLVVYNQSERYSDFESSIRMASVVYREDQPDHPFDMVWDREVVPANSWNYGAEFAGSSSRILFSRRRFPWLEIDNLMLAEERGKTWKTEVLKSSKLHSYRFPDWRSNLTGEGLTDYVEAVAYTLNSEPTALIHGKHR